MSQVMETIRSMFDEAIEQSDTIGQTGLSKNLGLLRMLVITALLAGEREKRKKTVGLVAFTRDQTKNTQSPFWRCRSVEGIAVNIFKHEDELKDNFHLFEKAGFGEILLSIQLGVSQNWMFSPVVVEIEEDGQFWKVVSVRERNLDQLPDKDDFSDTE